MDSVIAYCTIDVDALEFIRSFILENKYIVRTAKSGKKSKWVPFLVNSELRNVHRCITDALGFPPDTSWMDDPPDLHGPYEWAIRLLQNA